MTDYASLVAQLREMWPLVPEAGPATSAQRQLAQDAADAIEALRAERDALTDAGEEMLITLRGIRDAKRFDPNFFDSDSSFVDWAQNRARHTCLAYGDALAAIAAAMAAPPVAGPTEPSPEPDKPQPLPDDLEQRLRLNQAKHEADSLRAILAAQAVRSGLKP